MTDGIRLEMSHWYQSSGRPLQGAASFTNAKGLTHAADDMGGCWSGAGQVGLWQAVAQVFKFPTRKGAL